MCVRVWGGAYENMPVLLSILIYMQHFANCFINLDVDDDDDVVKPNFLHSLWTLKKNEARMNYRKVEMKKSGRHS